MANLYRHIFSEHGTASEEVVPGVLITGLVVTGRGTRDGFYIALSSAVPVLLMAFLSHLIPHQQGGVRSTGAE